MGHSGRRAQARSVNRLCGGSVGPYCSRRDGSANCTHVFLMTTSPFPLRTPLSPRRTRPPAPSSRNPACLLCAVVSRRYVLRLSSISLYSSRASESTAARPPVTPCRSNTLGIFRSLAEVPSRPFTLVAVRGGGAVCGATVSLTARTAEMWLIMIGIGRSRTAVGSILHGRQWVECELVVPLRKGCWLKSNTGASSARAGWQGPWMTTSIARPLGGRSWAPPHSTGGSGGSLQPRLTCTARRGR
mmetsp:Transcript_107097/g.310960  ORF Transcript_107097/g.310960 Transcript_107097/m.310960 type:complete len:244 (-) Transcript_107097:99-830(-)